MCAFRPSSVSEREGRRMFIEYRPATESEVITGIMPDPAGFFISEF